MVIVSDIYVVVKCMDRWIVLLLRMYIIFGTCNTKHRILLTSIITTFMHVCMYYLLLLQMIPDQLGVLMSFLLVMVALLQCIDY